MPFEPAKRGFVKAFGMPAFEYFGKFPDPRRCLRSGDDRHHGAEADPMLDAYDFSRFQELVDVGGGNGSLLAAILKRHEGMRGVLFDLPAVMDRATHGDRYRLAAGNFLESVPSGADAYLLRHVVHDWNDETPRAFCATAEPQ